MDNTTTNVQGREIKFRAFDKVTKQMSPEFVLFGEFLLLGAIHAWQFDSGNRSESSLEALEDLVIMQFTGKHDKEGTELYDGDIVEFDRGEWGGDDNIHVISWDEVNAEWSWGGGSTSDMHWRKKIGNLYEHAHLLKPEGIVVSEGLIDNGDGD